MTQKGLNHSWEGPVCQPWPGQTGAGTLRCAILLHWASRLSLWPAASFYFACWATMNEYWSPIKCAFWRTRPTFTGSPSSHHGRATNLKLQEKWLVTSLTFLPRPISRFGALKMLSQLAVSYVLADKLKSNDLHVLTRTCCSPLKTSYSTVKI